MYKHKTIINSEGYITHNCVLFINGEPSHCVLQENEIAVDFCKKPLIKGRLINGEWVETATEEEIQEYYAQQRI